MLTSSDDKIQLALVLGSWVHPRHVMSFLDSEEGVGNAKLKVCAKRKKPLTILIALTDSRMPKADGA